MQWKWQRIQAQIAAGGTSAARVFARMGREIAAAAVGHPDPDANAALAAALERVRGYGMPEAMIARAIESAADPDAVAATRLRLEGHGRDGIAFVIDILTDDAARTEGELAALLASHGARIERHRAEATEGDDGAEDDAYEDENGDEDEDQDEDAVRFSGLSTLGQCVLDEPTAYRALLGAGIDWFIFLDEDRPVVCQCRTERFDAVRAAFAAAGVDHFALVEHELEPPEYIDLPRTARSDLEALVEALEAHEDVLYVHHNVDLDDGPDEDEDQRVGFASPIDAERQALLDRIRIAAEALPGYACHGPLHVYGAGVDVVEATRIDVRLTPDYALRYVVRVQGSDNAWRPNRDVIVAGGRTYVRRGDGQAWEQLAEPVPLTTVQQSVAALFAPERLGAVSGIDVRAFPGELHLELRFDPQQLARVTGQPEAWLREDYVIDAASMLPKTLTALLVQGEDDDAVTVESTVTFEYDGAHEDIRPPAGVDASAA